MHIGLRPGRWVFEYDLKPWDYAASIAIITEAGGTVTNEKGEPIFPGERSAIVASNGHIHQEMLDLLASETHKQAGLLSAVCLCFCMILV